MAFNKFHSLDIRSFSSRLTPALLLLLAVVAFASVPAGNAKGADNRAPDVPASLKVPEGNKVEFHVFATGVQIYMWTGSSWMFQAPEANLFADSGRHGMVGTHFAGPTWESNSGSRVVGQRVAGVTVDSTAIQWLLLQAKTTQGPGIFNRTSYIQRVNTAGGLAPATPGTSNGQTARVPYTAEYFFYRETK